MQYYPALPNRKDIHMGKWRLIPYAPAYAESTTSDNIFKGASPHIISQLDTYLEMR